MRWPFSLKVACILFCLGLLTAAGLLVAVSMRPLDGDVDAHRKMQTLARLEVMRGSRGHAGAGVTREPGSGLNFQVPAAPQYRVTARGQVLNPKTSSFEAMRPEGAKLALDQRQMTNHLQTLIAGCRTEHACKPGASAEDIDAAELRIGYKFTDELLQACNGIDFWSDGNYPCRLLSVQDMMAAHDHLRTDNGPHGLIALVSMQADCVAIGLDEAHASYGKIVDCSHETFPYDSDLAQASHSSNAELR